VAFERADLAVAIVAAHSRSSFNDALQCLFGDDEAVAPNIVYYTDEPDTMPFVAFTIPQASYLLGGGHYIRGGSQVLSDRMVAIVREAGGACEATRDASAILLEGDRVCGVRHQARDARDSQDDIAPILFGNAAPSALAAMLPEQARPSFSALYNDRSPSISLWTISLGLSRRSREFGVRRYSTTILPAWVMALADIRQAGTFFHDDPGTRIPPHSFVAYDQIDSGLNPNGPYLVSMVGVDRLANWNNHEADAKRMRRELWMDRIISDLDSHFPGIAGAVVQREMSTAETFHHYLNTPEGAIYGFSPQTRGFMPLAKTRIAGLYLASAFTGGGGYTGAILGGAARAAIAARLG
jgi:all-trans-retinol 13,14-reductase